MQVRIKFRRTGSNTQYGSFAAGDIMRCSKELADHYIGIGVAKLFEEEKQLELPVDEEPEEVQEDKPPKRKAKE